MRVPDITSSIEIDPTRLNIRWTDGAMITEATYAQSNGDEHKNTPVCIKTYLIGAAQSPEQVAASLSRVQREATIWMGANHPNIIPCFGMIEITDGTVDPQPALVFLRCPNGSVGQYLASHGDVDLHSLVVSVARGLHYLHEKGVAHGHLRPHNIMVLDNGEAALSDICCSNFGENRRQGTTKDVQEADIYWFGIIALFIYARKLSLSDPAETLVGSELRPGDYPTVPKCKWDIISPCWEHSADARPAMAKVLERLLV